MRLDSNDQLFIVHFCTVDLEPERVCESSKRCATNSGCLRPGQLRQPIKRGTSAILPLELDRARRWSFPYAALTLLPVLAPDIPSAKTQPKREPLQMSSVDARAAGPLAGLRVLDLSRVFAGPVAGRILSDLGADVVKVEPPDGDVSRNWGRKIAGLSTYFVQQNVGKRNICVDLNHPVGVAIVQELATKADIVIENFRPGVLASFGLDWAGLSVINPRLLMLSISGFGQEGPESRRAAYASIAHAEMGLIARGPELDGAGMHDVTFSAADVT